MSEVSIAASEALVSSTGVAGLDELLGGGLPSGHVYLIEGVPGSGKTTLSLQFVLDGVRRGERALYTTLSESQEDLEKAAASHGWSLHEVDILELLSATDLGLNDGESLMFHPSEVELGATITRIVEAVERIKPARVVIDSLTEIRLQSQTALRYRREVLALRQFLKQNRCTALLLDELREEMTAQSVVHGIIELHRHVPDFGPSRREIQITKLRGVQFAEGFHDYRIEPGGIQVFPRLVAAEHRRDMPGSVMSSGLAELDALLGGGVPAGSTTLLLGPVGSGKSSTATHYVLNVLRQGERAAIYTFDETVASYLARAAGLGMHLDPFLSDGRLNIQQIDAGELSPGHFAHLVRRAVEGDQCRMLVIDSLNGYLNAMPNERMLLVQLHELTTYLNHKGVLTLLVMSQAGIGGTIDSPIDTSYLTDNVILFRLFEAVGEVRHAISVVKKRTGAHEKTIRELRLTSRGLQVGEPLSRFQGILSGLPQFVGHQADLIERES